MLINELIQISGDVSLTPTKILTGWGTEKNENIWTQTKKTILEGHLYRSGKTGGRILLYIPTKHG